MRKQDMGNQFSKKTRKKAGSIQAQRIFRSRWFKSLVAMGSAVVFFTVYSLIIPAATLTEDQAAADSGIVLEEPAPSEPQVVESRRIRRDGHADAGRRNWHRSFHRAGHQRERSGGIRIGGDERDRDEGRCARRYCRFESDSFRSEYNGNSI